MAALDTVTKFVLLCGNDARGKTLEGDRLIEEETALGGKAVLFDDFPASFNVRGTKITDLVRDMNAYRPLINADTTLVVVISNEPLGTYLFDARCAEWFSLILDLSVGE